MTAYFGRTTQVPAHLGTSWTHLSSRSWPTRAIALTPPCHHCQELDHHPSECALAPLEHLTRQLPLSRLSGYPRSGRRPTPYEASRQAHYHNPPPQAILALARGTLHRLECASRGTGGSALSQGPVPTPTPASPVAPGPTRRATARGPLQTQSSKGGLKHVSGPAKPPLPSGRGTLSPATISDCCVMIPLTFNLAVRSNNVLLCSPNMLYL